MAWSILGSGVTGLCIATALCEKGEKLEVVENPNIQAASYFAGGMLAPFCEGESAPDIVVKNGQLSVEWWDNHVSNVKKTGTIVIAPPRDMSELRRFANMTICHEWVDPGKIEKDLKGRFSEGLFFPSEAFIDPRLALQELKENLKNKGVSFHTGSPKGKIIDCTGMAATSSLKNLRAVRGEMLIFECHEVNFLRPIRLLHPRFPCYLVPRANGRFMVGATMVESNDDSPISARALIEMLSSVYAIHPAFAEARIIETGTGCRPSFPDNIPQIIEQDGKFYINGMYRHGFLLAPVLALDFVKKILG
ncbi:MULTISPECIES: FAD-dependent oxidoreductase [Commensalibacter]|uniref:FAD-dependent oxidoreductase n=1 Tax=Commensalibacter TaxID=1079922 RepID=UPI0012D8EF5F|nr:MULTISPECIES: FAD-dependent oxidoreductase [Commensalibacter]MCT6852732.1 FAD-dependent oxidoreductase [Commensalibacter sp.]MBH9970512.1 FAD-dependent oxidoreductase [Commensalibacter sp. M0265]MBH9973869.1 FAD-dependent oxidoreductase [Commensalibacter melissae]MBH9977793.1 FAD-dependent oxidoreductase [Commensalibacter sp. M0266]MBH9993547.1 FAD-dependent oxidoreductase [Commensalibacter sp. M0270]